MDEENLEQDAGLNSDENLNSEDAHSNSEGEEESPQSYKIGDKEYTAEQLQEFEKKAKDYEALLPDYTRKSQKLAELDKIKGQETSSKSRFEDPNYKPDNYNQYYQDIRAAIQEEQETEKKLAEEKQNEIKTQVDGFMAEIKGKDKNFDEKDFSDYAIRHNFTLNTINDLKSVYSAYKDLENTGKEKIKIKDNISRPSGGGSNNPNFSDIRASGKSIFDGALEAFNRIKS